MLIINSNSVFETKVNGRIYLLYKYGYKNSHFCSG